MGNLRNILVAGTVACVAMPALAAPTITSVAVTGSLGSTVWDTTRNSFYTVFVQPAGGVILNPNDTFSGATLNGAVNGNFDYDIRGDGFPTSTVRPARGQPQVAPNSDPSYFLTVILSEGAVNRTVRGVYNTTTGVYTMLSGPAGFVDGNYMLSDFSWSRTLTNSVGQFSSTDRSYNATTNPGSGFDYSGGFSISSAVPEPATWGLMICGFGAVGAMLRVRRRVAKVAIA